MSLHIDPFTVKETKIDGLKIINAKMVTVRELFRDSVYSDVLPESITRL